MPARRLRSARKDAGCTRSWETGYLAGAAAVLAQALYALDRLDEATGWLDRVGGLDAGDRWSQMTLRQVQAKVLARNGKHDEAIRMAREAVALGDSTDLLDAQGAAYADLGEVLMLAGIRARRPPPSNLQWGASSARATPFSPRARGTIATLRSE